MRHGNTENRVLEMLRIKNKTLIEIYTPIYGILTESKLVSLRRTLKRLILKGMIKKEEQHYIFIRDYEIIATIINTGKNQLGVNIPRINQTKNWELGNKIKLEKIK